MQEVHERVFVGSDMSCKYGTTDLAVVHACKSPCHQRVVGYKGALPNTHPNYLVLEEGNDLYLNIIDPPVPLFMPPLFSNFMNFASKHWNNNQTLLVHCNQGESRAPSLALLFLAKGLSVIADDSYDAARAEFEKIYPKYNPGMGIQIYFSKHWEVLGSDF